jgi:TRAP-type C4-dicarboxylate transport system permease small subunit
MPNRAPISSGRKSRSVLSALEQGANLVGAALFAVLFLALVIQVVRRFFFGTPAAWTEELAGIAYIWVIFWGAAFTLPLDEHAAVDLVVPRFSPKVRRALYTLGLAALALGFLWALPGTADYLSFMVREHTPVLGWPLGWVYSVFFAFAVMVVVRCVWRTIRPPQRDPSAGA